MSGPDHPDVRVAITNADMPIRIIGKVASALRAAGHREAASRYAIIATMSRNRADLLTLTEHVVTIDKEAS